MERYIGTFHKTGTALFESMLKRARNWEVLTPWIFHEEGPAPENWEIAFDYHTTKLLENYNNDENAARYVVCVRDPRDVIVSAAYYHCKSKESWLHVKKEEFGGLTYQEKINSLSNMQERFKFEMDHSSYWQIQNMLKLPQEKSNLYVTRLELLVQDYKLEEFHKIFSFLDFDAEKIPDLLKIAYSCSLFSGKIPKSVHARSGAPAQYKKEFTSKTMKYYEKKFGDAASILGYSD